jgi:hypothetical protein
MNDWSSDGYMWRSMGVQKQPRSSPLFKKYYSQISVGNGGHSRDFKRIAYRLLEDPCLVLVQYLGDNSKFKHGSGKRLHGIRERNATKRPVSSAPETHSDDSEEETAQEENDPPPKRVKAPVQDATGHPYEAVIIPSDVSVHRYR